MYNWHRMLSKHLSTKGEKIAIRPNASYVTRTVRLAHKHEFLKTTINTSACNEPFVFHVPWFSFSFFFLLSFFRPFIRCFFFPFNFLFFFREKSGSWRDEEVVGNGIDSSIKRAEKWSVPLVGRTRASSRYLKQSSVDFDIITMSRA